jgi:hypothetical protein
MSNPKTGGPAFPVALHNIDGMTLRDYFAAKALQGLLTNPDRQGDAYDLALYAYSYADVMLVARSMQK